MINLDMIGRNSERPVDITGVATAYGDILREAVEVSSSRFGLMANIVDRYKSTGGNSDHSSFNDVNIPNIFFFTGLHADYHRVTDHYDRLDYNRMAKIVNVVLTIAGNIGNLDNRLIYSK